MGRITFLWPEDNGESPPWVSQPASCSPPSQNIAQRWFNVGESPCTVHTLACERRVELTVVLPVCDPTCLNTSKRHVRCFERGSEIRIDVKCGLIVRVGPERPPKLLERGFSRDETSASTCFHWCVCFLCFSTSTFFDERHPKMTVMDFLESQQFHK